MERQSNNQAWQRKTFHLIFATIFILLSYSAAFAVPPKVTRFTLKNGIRVVILHVKNSRDVAIFSYLPLGLAVDGKEKTQWSHLIEHLTLRTTGPIADYRQRNGETTSQCMHLDFMGAEDEWRQGLELQTKWLSELPFSEEILREELPKALSETDTTSANLYTHKWAIAAWNQVFRHGQVKVAIRGDLQSAQLSDLQGYRDRHLVQPNRVLLCVIGGLEPETLKPALEERLGSIASTAKRLPAAKPKPEPAQQLAATWDLNVTHYIETYAIPKPDHEDYPALYVAAMLLNQYFFMDQKIKPWTGMVLCGLDLITPAQTYLYVSAPLKPGADIDKVRSQIKYQLDKLKQTETNFQVSMMASNVSKQMSAPPDITMAMRYKPANVTEAMIVGNIGLQWGLLEFQYGDTLPHLAKALARVSASDIASVAEKYLSKTKRGTLILTPKE